MTVNYDQEISKISKNLDQKSIDLIQKAFNMALKGHLNQKRKSGEPYITHCIEVAQILKEMGMDVRTIAAGFLHDIIEDTNFSLEDIKKEIDEEVAFLVEGVSYVTAKIFKTKGEKFSESLRKMFLAMSRDIRVVIIKLADRLHNMRTIQYLEEENQKKIAYETLNIYAPLAHRFGMQKIKSELEDISFKILYPEQYQQINMKINEIKEQSEKKINSLIKIIKDEIEKNKISAEIYGRIKHYYSIYQKMIRENKNLEDIYDLIAIRVITDTIANCYASVGLIHNVLKPVPGRFKDYIAMPKTNMYQSLHTTVLDNDGIPVEIQIRTYEMNKIAEDGIAAHWVYKEQKKFDTKLDNYFLWIKQILELQKNIKESDDFIKELKMDLFDEEIFVFTPKGEVKEFIKGATVLDFAYSIHSELGDKCIGAKVNGKWVSFKYELKNGDIVEILKGINQHPTLDWLKIVKTAKAKNRIRHWLKTNNDPKVNIDKGKELLDTRLKKFDIDLDKIPDEVISEILNIYNFNKIDDLFLSIGFGEISEIKIANNLLRLLREREKPKKIKEEHIESKRIIKGDIIVDDNLSEVIYRFARCCSPVPGDGITGILTKKGISIHRKDCLNLKKVSTPFIDVRWNEDVSNFYLSKIKIIAENKKNLINEIVDLSSKNFVYISSMSSSVLNGNLNLEITIKVKNQKAIEELIALIKKIGNIKYVERII